MKYQKKIWNSIHAVGKARYYKSDEDPTAFAREVLSYFPKHATILDIGCGAGNDALFFAKNGYRVVASDFSDVAILKLKPYESVNFHAEVLDIREKTPFSGDIFDGVYARLSLHYFSDKITKNIFREIYRILKPGGVFCFLCKSTKDPLYGKGVEIEKDMFEDDLRVRHFFSEKYAKECLGNMFEIEKIESGKEKFYDIPSAFVKVIARKIT